MDLGARVEQRPRNDDSFKRSEEEAWTYIGIDTQNRVQPHVGHMLRPKDARPLSCRCNMSSGEE